MCLTSTVQLICDYKQQQKVWKYKLVIFLCGLQMFFITKTVTTDLFIFKEKYEKGTLCLPSNNQASLLEKNFGFW